MCFLFFSTFMYNWCRSLWKTFSVTIVHCTGDLNTKAPFLLLVESTDSMESFEFSEIHESCTKLHSFKTSINQIFYLFKEGWTSIFVSNIHFVEIVIFSYYVLPNPYWPIRAPPPIPHPRVTMVSGGWYVTQKSRFSGLVHDHQALNKLDLKTTPILLFLIKFGSCWEIFGSGPFKTWWSSTKPLNLGSEVTSDPHIFVRSWENN